MEYNPKQLTRHHRCCVKNGGRDVIGNISLVPRKQHESFHTLFGHMTAEQIAEELNTRWIDPHYRMVVERIK